jgi:beta-barrel assembly-enhancing protease
MFTLLLILASTSDDAVRAAHQQDMRLATIGYRLTRGCAGVKRAEQRIGLPGLLVQDITQFAPRERDAARQLLSIGDAPTVVAVVTGSIGRRAGFETGDRIIGVNGVALTASVARTPYARMAQFEDLILKASSISNVTIDVRRKDDRLVQISLPAEAGCGSFFQVVPGGLHNTQADGRYVQISQGMLDLAQSDDELAVVTAHELAHNVLDRMGHKASAKQGEMDADRVGVWLMARADYDMRAVMRFWARVRKKADYGVFSDGSHPSWARRLAALEIAVEEMRPGTTPFPKFESAKEAASQTQKPR